MAPRRQSSGIRPGQKRITRRASGHLPVQGQNPGLTSLQFSGDSALLPCLGRHLALLCTSFPTRASYQAVLQILLGERVLGIFERAAPFDMILCERTEVINHSGSVCHAVFIKKPKPLPVGVRLRELRLVLSVSHERQSGCVSGSLTAGPGRLPGR